MNYCKADFVVQQYRIMDTDQPSLLPSLMKHVEGEAVNEAV